uniref:Uncharacterized protein n=1 Tax=Rhizophora mucronata TaxID=61149 RepID=A0A2P2QPX2_RHIMU
MMQQKVHTNTKRNSRNFKTPLTTSYPHLILELKKILT